ncbi:MAG: hypothetical protein R3D69_03260 [Xanthobacteraceae bacterium]
MTAVFSRGSTGLDVGGGRLVARISSGVLDPPAASVEENELNGGFNSERAAYRHSE